MKTTPILILLAFACACSQVPEQRIRELETKVDQLMDEKDISETVHRLFVYTDNRDWQKVQACFTERVRFDMTSLAGGEPAEMTSGQIVELWEQGLQGMHSVHHQVGNMLVNLKGDTAGVFCYGIAVHYLPNESGEDSRIFVGTYHLELIRAGDHWKISLFRYNLKFLTGNRELDRYKKKQT